MYLCTDNGSVKTTITDHTSTMSLMHRLLYSSGGLLNCLQLYQRRGHVFRSYSMYSFDVCMDRKLLWVPTNLILILEIILILSCCGVHQGDPQDPMVFAVALHPLIEKIQARSQHY